MRAFSVILAYASCFLLFSSSVFSQETSAGGCNVTFELGSNITLCSSLSVYSLGQGSPSGGTYSGQGVFDDFFFPSLAGTGEHIISYTYTDQFCNTVVVDTITVVLATPLLIGGDFEICNGDTTTITALNNHDIEWDTGSNSVSQSFSPQQTTTYTVYSYDDFNCLSAMGFEIVVNDLPEIGITGDFTLCDGETTVLTATGAISYIWSNQSMSTTIVQTPLTTQTYSVLGTDINGCKSSALETVFVNPYPQVSIAGDTIVCAGDTTQLTASGADVYLWNGMSSGETKAFTGESDFVVSLSGISAAACSTSIEIAIQVLPLPLLSVFADADSLCIGDSILIEAMGADSYQWSNGSASNSITVIALDDIGYEVTGTGINGCNLTQSDTLEVNELPIILIIGDTAACSGTTLLLTASGAQSYSWNGVNSDSLLSIVISDTVFYTVIGTDSNGCKGSAEIIVDALAAPTLQLLGDTIVCVGDTSIFMATGAQSYFWSDSSTDDSLLVAGLSDQLVEVTGQGLNGCTSFASITLYVYPNPQLYILGDSSICEGDSSIFTVIGAEEYSWSNGITDDAIWINSEDTMHYAVSGISQEGCVGSAELNITVVPIPQISGNDNISICPGESTVLFAYGAEEYLWNNLITGDSIEVSPTSDSAFSVVGTDINGCRGTYSIAIDVFETPEIVISLTDSIICLFDPPMELFAEPQGGSFSGIGVSGQIFDPFISTIGNQAITYSIIDDNNCASSATAYILVFDCSGIGDQVNNKILIYPNPVIDQLTLYTEIQPTSIQIMALDGKVLHTSDPIQSGKIDIDTTFLPSGIYYLHGESALGQWTQQFIKE